MRLLQFKPVARCGNLHVLAAGGFEDILHGGGLVVFAMDGERTHGFLPVFRTTMAPSVEATQYRSGVPSNWQGEHNLWETG